MRQYTREQFAKKLGADSDPKLNAAADFAARLLNEKLQARSRSLYDEHVIMGPDDAQPIIDLAQDMLGFLKRKLDEPGGDKPA